MKIRSNAGAEVLRERVTCITNELKFHKQELVKLEEKLSQMKEHIDMQTKHVTNLKKDLRRLEGG